MREGTIHEVREISKKKCEFLFNNFGKMIKINDENVYNIKNTISKKDLDEEII